LDITAVLVYRLPFLVLLEHLVTQLDSRRLKIVCHALLVTTVMATDYRNQEVNVIVDSSAYLEVTLRPRMDLEQ